MNNRRRYCSVESIIAAQLCRNGLSRRQLGEAGTTSYVRTSFANHRYSYSQGASNLHDGNLTRTTAPSTNNLKQPSVGAGRGSGLWGTISRIKKTCARVWLWWPKQNVEPNGALAKGGNRNSTMKSTLVMPHSVATAMVSVA